MEFNDRELEEINNTIKDCVKAIEEVEYEEATRIIGVLKWKNCEEAVEYLVEKMEESKRRIKVGDVVMHFKRSEMEEPGDKYLYLVEGIYTNTETGEKMVGYHALYSDEVIGVDYDDYVRPYKMFMGKVDREKYSDAIEEYRFKKYLPEDGKYPEYLSRYISNKIMSYVDTREELGL